MAATAIGCQGSPPAAPSPEPATQAVAPSSALTVQVIGDEELAEGVRRLRGEWKARSSGELQVESTPLSALDSPQAIAADVVIFPSRWLGELVERKSLRPIRGSVLASAAFGLNDVYPAIRNGEMKYGGETFALPLGSPPLLLYGKPSAATSPAAAKGLPHSWQQYRSELRAAPAAMLAVPALAGRAAAFTLLARALAYMEVSRRYEAMWDPGTMKPRITDPPFVRALAEIREEAVKEASAEPLDFAAALDAVRAGKSLFTLTWPGAADDAAAAASTPPGAFAPLPISDQVYSMSEARWQSQSFPTAITLLGAEGRLIGVTQGSRNAVSAFQLAQWLASGDVAIELSSRSRGTIWWRSSQASSYARWTRGEVAPDQHPSVSEVVAMALKSESPLMAPRIPGIDQYLDALSEAVRNAAPGEAGAKSALESAAAAWETITDRLGREAQSAAYRRHLGIEPYSASP